MLTGTEPQLPSRHALKISLICHSATCSKRLRRPTTSSEKPRGKDRESESLKVDLHASRAEIFRELERRWAQIPVDKEYHTEPEQVEFPQAAWSEKIFRDFREGIVPCTEAAPEKLWSALLVAAGLMLGRNVRLENPKPIYVNFYTLQVGETGDARKSTVLWITAELLRRVDDDDVEILSGMVSTEGIFERLAKNTGTRALGYVDELRSLLAVARRKGITDLLPKLNSLYYCPERESIDRREKSTTIVEPFFSIISATTLGYVEDLLGNAEIVGGTINRFLIIPGKEQEPKPFAEAPSKQAWGRITGPHAEIRDHWDVDRILYRMAQVEDGLGSHRGEPYATGL